MKTFLAGIGVAIAAATCCVAVATAARDAPAGKTYTLRDGDQIVLPKLDLTCNYGVFGGPTGWQRMLECGRTSTERDGVRTVTTRKVAELWHWSEGPGWRLIARTKRNP